MIISSGGSPTSVKATSNRKNRRLIWVLPTALILLGAVALLFLQLRADLVRQGIADFSRELGYGAIYRTDADLISSSYTGLNQLLKNIIGNVADIPELTIDVKFRNMQKIYAKRNEALKRGILVQSDDDFVSGNIRYLDQSIPIKLRLKGDWTDHLEGRKWSFRIHVKGKNQLFGMRRFSLQNPSTRNFQSEAVYLEALRQFGVLAPRYQFVNVSLNGKSMGLMALEESFSKELLESSGHREGVIVRYKEDYVWAAKDGQIDGKSGMRTGFGGTFDNYLNAPIDAFSSSKIAESESLTAQYGIAVGLLRGFAEGKLSAEEAFDPVQMGRFLAIADMFGAWHSLNWINRRFYLNPVTLLLEPIGYDGSLGARQSDEKSVVGRDMLNLDILRSPVIFSEYKRSVALMAEELKNGELLEQLAACDAQSLEQLRTEFPMLGNFPLDTIGTRVIALNQQLDAPDSYERFITNHKENNKNRYPVLVHAERIVENGQAILELTNAVPWKIKVTSVHWVIGDSTDSVPVTMQQQVPITLPARGYGTRPATVRIPYEHAPPDTDSSSMHVSARILGRNWDQDLPVSETYPALARSPIPQSTINEQLLAHPFLEADTKQRVMAVKPGSWEVKESLVLPPGYALRIEAGTHLRFSGNAVLVARGPLYFSGTPDLPVVLEAQSQDSQTSWPGVAVLDAGATSVWKYVEINNTRSISEAGWQLTGGVNFYNSDVTIEHSRFSNSLGEDALNIVSSHFEIDDLAVETTASDAFDADFSNGSLTNSEFTNIGLAGGGDAFDVSGSVVTVNNSSFKRISDKAMSIGEGSMLKADAISFVDVGTALASKDGSTAAISNSSVTQASYAALVAYIKKPEFGPAVIDAEAIMIDPQTRPALAQTNSRITLDGEEMATEDVDVAALYDTIMKPGLRR